MATIDEVIHRYMQEKESKRHTRVEEGLAKDRIQKDRDVAESRRQTSKDVAEIRSKASKDKLEFDKIVEERRVLREQHQYELGKESNSIKRDRFQKDFIQKDKELAQKQLVQTQKVEHWNSQLIEKQFEFDNPAPAKPPMDRMEITLPDGTKQVLHRGQPGWDEFVKRQQESESQNANNEAEAKRKRDIGIFGRIGEFFGGKPVPKMPSTGTNPPASAPMVPGATNGMPVPPPMPATQTITNQTPFSPSQIPGVGNGMTAPPMPATNVALPGIGRQMTPPTPLPPASDYMVPDPGASGDIDRGPYIPKPGDSTAQPDYQPYIPKPGDTTAKPTLLKNKKVRVKGPGGKSGTVPDGSKLPEGWSFE